PHTHHYAFAGVQGDVAPLRAAGADGRRLVELPRARLVQEVLGQEGADRTQIDDVARPGVIQAPIGMDPDEGAVAPLGHVEDGLLRHVLHESDAARAQDAAVRDVEDVATDRKSTRLNSSHGSRSYAVFCLKKKGEVG